MGEREIRVTMNPHEWDNKNNPYFWFIAEWSESNKIWFNSGLYGWAKNPADAWNAAYIAWLTNSLEPFESE